MKRIRPFVAAGALLLAVAVIAPTYGVWTAPPPNPAVICTVDLERVFNEIDARKKAEADLEIAMLAYQTRLQELHAAAERLSEDREALVPGTDKFDEAQKELMQAALDFKAMSEFVNLKLDATRAEMRRDLFDKISTEASKYAVANGIDFIITDDSKVPIQEGTDIQVVQQLALRRIIHANPVYDITDGLIDYDAVRSPRLVGELRVVGERGTHPLVLHCELEQKLRHDEEEQPLERDEAREAADLEPVTAVEPPTLQRPHAKDGHERRVQQGVPERPRSIEERHRVVAPASIGPELAAGADLDAVDRVPDEKGHAQPRPPIATNTGHDQRRQRGHRHSQRRHTAQLDPQRCRATEQDTHEPHRDDE